MTAEHLSEERLSPERSPFERGRSERASTKALTGKPTSGRPAVGKAGAGKQLGLRPSRVSLPRVPALRSLTESVHSPLYGVLVAVSIAVLVGAALLHVWTRLEVIRIGYALSEQTKLHRALREHEQRLRLELATQKDPAAIERVAREQLHMAPPDPSSIRIVGRAGRGPSASRLHPTGAPRPSGAGEAP